MTFVICLLFINKKYFKFFIMAKYYFPNKLEDYSQHSVKSLILSETEINPNCKVAISCNVKLKHTEDRCELHNLDLNDYSVYTGTAGIALLKLKKDPETKFNLENIKKQLLGLKRLKGRRHSFLCGDAGPLAIGITICHKLKQHDEKDILVKRLYSMNKDVLNIHSDLPNEYLYGRAGYLYAILYVNKNVSPNPFDDNFVREIIEAIFVCGETLSKALKLDKCPLMYEWHNSYYLGAAHGLSGIIYLLLQAKEYLTDDDLNNLIKPTIDYLATLRFPSGNFPSSLGTEKPDKYVQWCHGAPGFLYMYSLAYKVFGDPEYLQLAIDCGEVVWQRGLLKKGYSLCHGVSGNAYCFLELYQTTKEEKHLFRALKFAEYCVDHTEDREEHSPDRPLSLYEGISGPTYLLLDIQKPLEAKFPGYTL